MGENSPKTSVLEILSYLDATKEDSKDPDCRHSKVNFKQKISSVDFSSDTFNAGMDKISQESISNLNKKYLRRDTNGKCGYFESDQCVRHVDIHHKKNPMTGVISPVYLLFLIIFLGLASLVMWNFHLHHRIQALEQRDCKCNGESMSQSEVVTNSEDTLFLLNEGENLTDEKPNAKNTFSQKVGTPFSDDDMDQNEENYESVIYLDTNTKPKKENDTIVKNRGTEPTVSEEKYWNNILPPIVSNEGSSSNTAVANSGFDWLKDWMRTDIKSRHRRQADDDKGVERELQEAEECIVTPNDLNTYCERRDSKFLVDNFVGDYYEHFDFNTHFITHDTIHIQDKLPWGEGVASRDACITFYREGTLLPFFNETTTTAKKENTLRLLNQTTPGSFKVLKSGLYLIHANVTIVDDSDTHFLALFLQNTPRLICQDNVDMRLHMRKDERAKKFRLCDIFGMLSMDRNDTLEIRTMQSNTTLRLHKWPYLNVVFLGKV